jgi:hypothetical protein
MINMTIENTTEAPAAEEFDIFSSLNDIVVQEPFKVAAHYEEDDSMSMTEDDFNNLDDLGNIAPEQGGNVPTDEDGDDILGLEDEAFEDLEEYIEDGEAEEEAADGEAQLVAFDGNLSSLADDAQLVIGDYTLTKADLAGLVSNSEEVKETALLVKNQRDTLQGLDTVMQSRLHAASTETSLEMQRVESQLNDPHVPAIHKGELVEKYNTLRQRNDYLTQNAIQYAKDIAGKKSALTKANVQRVGDQLSAKYDDNAISDVVNYAQAQGMTNQEISEHASLPFFEAMIKAAKYDANVQKSKGVIKNNKKGPVRTVKSGKGKQVVSKAKGSRANAEKLASSGSTGADVFANLID